MRLAIADPPYPPQRSERRDLADGGVRITSRSRARHWYGDGPRESSVTPADFHPDAGEWDDPARHRALLEELMDTYDGWAIATTPDGLDCYRPLPVRGPERLQVPDVLSAAPPSRGFAGAKPPTWTRWVLTALGYDPNEDELVDMFPGSGAVSSAAAGLLL